MRRPLQPARLRACAMLLLLACALRPAAAHAGEAEQAALQAQLIHNQLCAEITSTGIETGRAANVMAVLSDTWGKVDEVYKSTGESFLLYWRGLLGECLGQDELAQQDLVEFIKLDSKVDVLVDQLRDARARLRRMGVEVAPRAPQPGAASKAPSAAAASSGGRIFIGLGAGYQRSGSWNYLGLAIDLAVRIKGPLALTVVLRPGISEPATATDGLPIDPSSRSLLFAFGAGVQLRWDGPVRPEFGVIAQLAPNPDGSGEPRFLAGAALGGGLEFPLGATPLALRVHAEVGFLAKFPTARVLGQVVLGF